MGTLTIRNLDDRVVDRLRRQARANQRSLEGEVRFILSRQSADRERAIAAFRERTRRLLSGDPAPPDLDGVTLLREDRDR